MEPRSRSIRGLLSHLHSAIVPPLRMANATLRALVATTHLLQYKVEGFLRPDAEWFDHAMDAYWQWPRKQRSMFLERGVMNTLAMRPGAQILELCCGDGFYSHLFYASRGAHVLAVDQNASAVRHARRFHGHPRIEYRRCDIRDAIPEGSFDNVVWDSAIHHFTPPEVRSILASIHRVLADGGVLSGYTEIGRA